MQKSTILFLISILFLVVSCASNNFEKELKPVTLENTIYNVPYFANPEIDYAYKANISVYGNDLSGIFIAKKINATTHRVVFTTEFGNKLLDFEISAHLCGNTLPHRQQSRRHAVHAWQQACRIHQFRVV